MSPYKCEKCNKEFKLKSNYIKHTKKKKPCQIIRKIACPLCQKKFTNHNYLQPHLESFCQVTKKLCDLNYNHTPTKKIEKNIFDNCEVVPSYVECIFIDNYINHHFFDDLTDKYFLICETEWAIYDALDIVQAIKYNNQCIFKSYTEYYISLTPENKKKLDSFIKNIKKEILNNCVILNCIFED